MGRRGDRRRAKDKARRYKPDPDAYRFLLPEDFDDIPVVDGPVWIVPELDDHDRAHASHWGIAALLAALLGVAVDLVVLSGAPSARVVDCVAWSVPSAVLLGVAVLLFTDRGARLLLRTHPLVVDEVGIASDRVARWSDLRAVAVEHKPGRVFVSAYPKDERDLSTDDLHTNAYWFQVFEGADRALAALRTFVPPELLLAEKPLNPLREPKLGSARPLPRRKAVLAFAQAFGITLAAYVLCAAAFVAEGYHLWSSGFLVVLLVATGFFCLCRWLYRTRLMTTIPGMLALLFLVEGTGTMRDAVHSVLLRVDGHAELAVVGDLVYLNASEVRSHDLMPTIGFDIPAYEVADRSGVPLPGGVGRHAPETGGHTGRLVVVVRDSTGRFDVRLPSEVAPTPDVLRGLVSYAVMLGLLYGGFTARSRRTSGATPGRAGPAADGGTGTATRPQAPAAEA